ncbi:hypothetical protein LINPERHAP1_LOCUS20278 [Linum perenne]
MYSPFGTKICSSRIAWLGGKVRLMIAECFETHSHGREGLEYQKVRHLSFSSDFMPSFMPQVSVGI